MRKKKLNLRYYSKTSLIIRGVISIILLVSICLVIAFKDQISKRVYNWDEQITDPQFAVHYIDVGQGDATLIEFDDGKTMLIDCGPKSASEDLVDYIKAQDVEVIDYFLLTHADSDHVGGGVRIFQEFEVANFYRPMTRSLSEAQPADYPQHTTLTYDEVIKAFYSEEGATMFYTSSQLQPLSGDNYTVNFLYPDKAYSDTNASSAILKIELGSFKFLFMGDASTTEESKLVDKYGYQLKCDVLKVGHHGAKTSTGTNLLSHASPYYAVISVGENSYGHPSREVQNNLKAFNVNTYNTLTDGDLCMYIDSGILNVGTDKGKMIDYALICTILAMILLITWGIPDFKIKKRSKPSIENKNKI